MQTVAQKNMIERDVNSFFLFSEVIYEFLIIKFENEERELNKKQSIKIHGCKK